MLSVPSESWLPNLEYLLIKWIETSLENAEEITKAILIIIAFNNKLIIFDCKIFVNEKLCIDTVLNSMENNASNEARETIIIFPVNRNNSRIPNHARKKFTNYNAEKVEC